MSAIEKKEKPLGAKAYGSIPHLPGSRRGPGDHGISEKQAALLLEKTRDARDLVTVQEKLDGSNVAVARIGFQIVPLIRAGYRAADSNWKQHHFFHEWAMKNAARFASLLGDGERVVGEWLMEAHGTRYALAHEPFVAFDIIAGDERRLASAVQSRCAAVELVTPRVIHAGSAIGIDAVVAQLGRSGHGALDPVEGAVWRMEREGKVDFLAKYVRPEKMDGCYLEQITGAPPVLNWRP